MKKITFYIREHIRNDFSLFYYGSIIILLSIFLYVNYRTDFVDTHVSSLDGWNKWGAYFLFYCVGYFTSLSILKITDLKQHYFSSPMFWKYSLMGLSVLSLDSSMPFLQDFIFETCQPKLSYWVYKVSVNGISFFTIVIPLFIFYFINDKKETHRYGFNSTQIDLKTYWMLILCMFPILLSASFLDSFQQQYPMYKVNQAYQVLQVPSWIPAIIYEFAYGLDFITVELLFRGFFVIGMIKILGRKAIVPMAVIYCMLHFGKPAGEAISSVFGGFILGIIAYETRSVWGGVIVHVGIAWMMEILAYLID